MIQKVVLLPLSALVSLTLIWYFVPPEETIKRLFVSKTITWFFLVQWAVIYAELAFLGRRFCTSICPYSMLQSGLFDRDTLVISFKERTDEHCMGCDKCVRVCPVGIDIKKGLRRECIACAECIDACISMTEKRGIKPFIGYTGRPWRLKNLILALVVSVFTIVFLIVFYLRPEVEFVISRDPVAPVKEVNSYSYSIYNNTSKEYIFRLTVNEDFVIIGNNTVRLEPFGSVRGKVMVRRIKDSQMVRFTLSSKGLKIQREAGFL
ncbi:MAG: 4Fe-4S dicluster domain-containing protein [Nitrospirae bacterium]|nr:4Fe-4S dicluster domain-containing protein [Nitrospirota bacterium]